jgi:membrane protease YdiL (CAAX protease family)
MKSKRTQYQTLQRDVRLIAILVAILALLFALYLVGIGISALATLFTFFAFLLFVSPYMFLGSPAVRKQLKTDYASRSVNSLLGFSGMLVVLANGYALVTNQFSTQFAIYSIIWIVVTGGLIFLLPKQKSPTFIDYILIVVLWLPIEFGFLDNITIPAVQSVVNPFSLIGLVVLIYVYTIIRDFDIGYTFRLNAEDYRVVVLDFVVLFLLLLIVGMLTKFMSITNHMPAFKEMIIQFGFIFFLIALPEELFFRGVIFSLLKKQFQRKKRAVGQAMIFSSVLFGLAHLNNPIGPLLKLELGSSTFQLPWALVLISTVAGLFYCFVFIRTKRITAAAAIHLLVNWVYFSFFQ